MMIEKDIRPYEKLYSSVRYMGANDLFRRFYDLGSNAVVPLSLAHGVDYGQCHRPMDIDSVEPIHWSCNSFMHEAAVSFKPSLLLPHPWVMQTYESSVPPGNGVLVIGPPPSPENDESLYKLIKQDIQNNWSILIKARGPYQDSMRYWAKRGVKPITASGPDGNFYARLFDFLSQYETVVGCAFSSALVFAASIGKHIEILKGFTFKIYETATYEEEINLKSIRASSIVKEFVKGDQATNQNLSRELLGFDHAGGKLTAMQAFREKMVELRRPFWSDPRLRIPYILREKLAMHLNKAKIINADVNMYIDHFRSTGICIMSINHIDVLLNGKSSKNFHLEPVRRIRGITELGRAPNGYLK